MENNEPGAEDAASETAGVQSAEPGAYPSATPVDFITQDSAMLKILSVVEKVASRGKASILIHGESGTGKEVVARMIHNRSPRATKPFVAVNCAALPENLLESELFGYEKGAFTGAVNRKLGKFELADKGTILLDEITEMDMALQAKLLRVLQEEQVDRIGGRAPVHVDIRVVATTNREIENAITDGKFREDLYYRLNVIPLHLLPLRERKGDIPLLGRHFLKKFNKQIGGNVRDFTKEAVDVLQALNWRGNVRELENVIERAVLLCDGELIRPEDLFIDTRRGAVQEPATGALSGTVPSAVGISTSPIQGGDDKGILFRPGMTVQEMEKLMIFNTLDEVDGNRTRAAELLGLSIRTLRNKLNEYKVAKYAAGDDSEG